MCNGKSLRTYLFFFFAHSPFTYMADLLHTGKGVSGRLDGRQVLASRSNAAVVASKMGHPFSAITRVYGNFLRPNALLRRQVRGLSIVQAWFHFQEVHGAPFQVSVL
jgi:hypothetical protein